MLVNRVCFSPKIHNTGLKNNIAGIYNTRNITFTGEDKFEKKYPYLVKGNPEDFPREKVVAVYCSSGEKGYDNAYDLGRKVAEAGMGVLTGGTVGNMEALNKGCYEAGGYSIGVSEKTLEAKQPPNKYLHEHHSTPDGAAREEWYNKRAAYTVVLGGGPGTIAETFNKLVFLLKDKFFKEKTQDSERFQHLLILVEDDNNRGMWNDLRKWYVKYPVALEYSSPRHIAHVQVVDSNEEAINVIKRE